MKTLLTIILTAILLITSAMAETMTIDLATASDAELLAARDAIMLELANRTTGPDGALLTCEIRGCTVTLTEIRHAVTRDGDPGLALYFSCTNGTEDITTFQLTAWVLAYQDGVECKSTWVTDTDSLSRGTRIQPGGTSTDANWGLAITDPDGTIEIHICDATDYKRPVYGTIIIDLSTID